jgi:rhamnulokinase
MKGQPVPETVGAMSRCIFESLALKYRYVLDLQIRLTGKAVEVVHVVGGGAQNALLCQMAANAMGRPVLAGPVEATALGNAVSQLIALGDLASVHEGRRLISESFPLTVYQPQESDAWEAAYQRFCTLL